MSAFKTKVKNAKKASSWRVGSWNVRSLLDSEGPVETARQGRDTAQGEDRRIDQVVMELNRYNVKIAALQETKWFGNAMYRVGESIVVAAGRPVPKPGETLQRGEGVAIVLSGPAVRAWKEAGEKWKVWSPRLISAQLRTGKREHDILHILSCYAPTRAATRGEKDSFYDDLQQILTIIPPDEQYVMLGDFNARVGSRDSDGDLWNNVRGPHGYGEVNDAGKELLAFLSTNEATVCNTWFMKKAIHKQTWQHPRSKQWHCIDFAVMRQKDRKMCLDVAVMRGAECHTDHQLLCVRVRVPGKGLKHKTPAKAKQKRFDVAKLAERRGEEDNCECTPRERFQDETVREAQAAWPQDGSVEEKWKAIRLALTKAAESVLGSEQRRQPDWFQESKTTILPALEHRNRMYTQWLATGDERDLQKFRSARAEARQAVRTAKNAWFQAKADEAQKGRFSGKRVWKCIRDMQSGRRGLLPTRSSCQMANSVQHCQSNISGGTGTFPRF